MGKFEEAIRKEVLRLVRKEMKQHVLPLEKEVRELRRALNRAQQTVPGAQPAVRPTVLNLTVDEATVRKARLSGDLIRKLRRRLGVSQSQLAAIVGVTPGAVAQWELSSVTPRGKNREALVALRKVSRREVKAALQATANRS